MRTWASAGQVRWRASAREKKLFVEKPAHGPEKTKKYIYIPYGVSLDESERMSMHAIFYQLGNRHVLRKARRNVPGHLYCSAYANVQWCLFVKVDTSSWLQGTYSNTVVLGIRYVVWWWVLSCSQYAAEYPFVLANKTSEHTSTLQQRFLVSSRELTTARSIYNYYLVVDRPHDAVSYRCLCFKNTLICCWALAIYDDYVLYQQLRRLLATAVKV